jgi:phage shock protein C
MKKLYLSTTDRKLSGVCGGIGAYFGIDPGLIRLGWIVFTVLSGILPGIIAYLIAAVVIPAEPTDHPAPTAREGDV